LICQAGSMRKTLIDFPPLVENSIYNLQFFHL
jgi:hypothetical protein